MKNAQMLEEIGGEYVLRKQSNFRQTGVPTSDV